jgi:hypothetical protein
MDSATITLARFGIFILAGLLVYFSIWFLIDPDFAWSVHEAFAEFRGRNTDTMYRTESWDFFNKLGSLFAIGVAIYLVFFALNLKTSEELWHEAAQQAFHQTTNGDSGTP